jgi:hypothetical protein
MGDEKLPTQDADALGPMPEGKVEPREPNPGGADALPQEDDVTAADLVPEKNPAVEQETPDALKEREDTDTEATKNGDEVAPEDESPA